jgi:NADPH:quinone reductase-like Zn-dependent oxidoreductase
MCNLSTALRVLTPMKLIAYNIVVSVLAIVVCAAGARGQAPLKEMTAVRIHEFGGRDVLKVEQAPRPTPGTGEMLVRVHAAGVNPVDWKVRKSGGRGWLDIKLAFTPGYDVSGVVEEMGEGVTRFKVGDEVFAYLSLNRGGAYAEYAVVKFAEAAKKPAKASHVEAAAVPLAALTAWQALFNTAKLEQGQTVLVHAGAGGVGTFAVQLAKWKGSRVIATASKENHDFLKQLGVDEVIDYKAQKFDELVKDVDVVLDSVGGRTTSDSFKVLKKGGILVSIVGDPSPEQAKLAGVRAEAILVQPNAEQLEQLAKLIDEGRLKPVVSHVFPLKEVAKAHEQSETGHTRGKIVLRVVEE